MQNGYVVAGFRKNSDGSKSQNFNAYVCINERHVRKMFAWVDGPNGKDMRSGANHISLDEIIQTLNTKGQIWCENDSFFYVFKKNRSYE